MTVAGRLWVCSQCGHENQPPDIRALRVELLNRDALRAVLTQAKAIEIRQEYRRYSKEHGAPALAKKHNISLNAIYGVVTEGRYA